MPVDWMSNFQFRDMTTQNEIYFFFLGTVFMRHPSTFSENLFWLYRTWGNISNLFFTRLEPLVLILLCKRATLSNLGFPISLILCKLGNEERIEKQRPSVVHHTQNVEAQFCFSYLEWDNLIIFRIKIGIIAIKILI